MNRQRLCSRTAALLLVVAVQIAAAPLPASAETETMRILAALKDQDATLDQAAKILLDRLRKLRADELDRMRAKMQRDMDDWESGLTDLDGAALKATLADAYAVAESYGMDVPHLEAMYEQTKSMIRRLEFAALCGPAGGTGSELAAGLRDAPIVGNVVHFYGLVDREEERLACAAEKRVQLYKDTSRAFIRALTVPDPKESEKSFMTFAANLRTLNEADALAFAAEAERLAAEQKLVVGCMELVPLVGEAMDVLALAEGEDLAGRKWTTFEKSLALVMLVTPDALEQFIRRYPGAVPAVGRFLGKLARPKGGFVDSLIVRGGQEADALARKAGALLDRLGRTDAGRAVADLAGVAAGGARSAWKVADDTVQRVSAELPGLIGLRAAPGTAGEALEFAAAAARSNMPESWINALTKTAKDRNEIIFVRPVNPHARPWLESGEAVTKGMHIKGKTADWGPMAGLIPVDQRLSKLGNPEAVARQIDDAAALLMRSGVPADDAVAQARRIVVEQNARKVTEYGEKVGESLGRRRPIKDADGNVLRYVDDNNAQAFAHSAPLVRDGREVVKVSDAAGNVQVRYRDELGRLPPGVKVEPVEVLIDPATGKYLTADADLLGVGTARSQGKIHADAAVQGSVSDAELATAFQANVHGRMEGNIDRFIQHGPATRFADKPDFPVTMILPDGRAAIIEDEASLKAAFKAAKKSGMTGLDPDPGWGWKEGWDR